MAVGGFIMLSTTAGRRCYSSVSLHNMRWRRIRYLHAVPERLKNFASTIKQRRIQQLFRTARIVEGAIHYKGSGQINIITRSSYGGGSFLQYNLLSAWNRMIQHIRTSAGLQMLKTGKCRFVPRSAVFNHLQNLRMVWGAFTRWTLKWLYVRHPGTITKVMKDRWKSHRYRFRPENIRK